MFYIIYNEDNYPIQAVSTNYNILPIGAVEVTEEQYIEILNRLHDDDIIREEEKYHKIIDDKIAFDTIVYEYVRQVQNGEITIEEIPIEYRQAVDNIINPPEEEEQSISIDVETQLAALSDAVDFILMNMEVSE